ncbi:PREDICTED: tetraspanin-8-like [Nicotiana attenuata]|uniref:tetraspanin-8-like n=1 Tax=Nicotiana attenuata TaxID=49451 RepID=UPI000904FAB2|nr:PREDICTED: tetraspanin-8-like [Nicotiana attenuata]
MVQVSNSIITFNLVNLGFSLVCLWPLDEEFPCRKLLQTPLLILGASLLVLSLLGFVGFGWRVTFFMWLYLFLLFLFMLGLLCFSAFTIMVTNKNVSRALSGKNYKDLFELGDYSHWLQKYVVNSENWEEIKSCLIDTEYCQRLPTGNGVDFYKYSLSAMQVI